mmetsp:Transcript_31207/g.58169  ORF Transcript_31207/g.58169 Transcript_31207/m.58169 type:complete len:216 (+) Transcript_31207:80-727(+)
MSRLNIVFIASLLSLGESLSLNTSRTSGVSKRRSVCVLDELLAVDVHHEGRNIDEVPADADVALADETTRMVDGLGQLEGAEHASLETAGKELFYGKPKHVIELLLALGKKTHLGEAHKKGTTLELTLGVLLRQGHEVPGNRTNLGKSVLHAPDLTLVLETVHANELELAVKALLLERTARRPGGLATVAVIFSHASSPSSARGNGVDASEGAGV